MTIELPGSAGGLPRLPDPKDCVKIEVLMEIKTGKVQVSAPMDTKPKKLMCMEIIAAAMVQILGFPETGIVLAQPGAQDALANGKTN